MNVGVIELIAYTVPPEWHGHTIAVAMRKVLYSVMPQVVAAWCRRRGHRTHYATYYGQSDPVRLLPDDLHIVFISATTQASGLAYALARYYRGRGVRTVLGGPHAKCFPADALRFFDIVVGECDEELVSDILAHRFDPPAFVSGRRPRALPGVAERFPDIVTAGFRPGRRFGFNVVAVFSSLGCPYTCEFCTEWNSRYAPLPADDLAADLAFVRHRDRRAIVAFHDPNFAVRFDETMDVMERDGERPNRYVMECSLSVLRDDRLPRLARTNCLYVAPGVESWFDFGNKSLAGEKQGAAKLDFVAERFRALRRFVPGLQANFLFGTDADRGAEPVELTIDFVRRLPFVWPNVNVPTPYGATPLFDRYRADGRVLTGMPLACYCAPYLVSTLRHYDPVTFYRHLVRIQTAITSWAALARRVAHAAPFAIRFAHAVQTLSFREQAAETRAILRLLEADREFRAFHEGERVPVPEFYQRHVENRLGRYASLFPRADRTPVLGPVGRAANVAGLELIEAKGPR
ncbi:B12 binding domain protein [Gemmata sp. SH-PL17]|uniref:B12-binding domain-containing radical SAM protein n=1 Tax=Gemmata sp. SH-PL17 TaxID=1630693 RepID=UPI00078B2FB4|nr:radical SAM protein [Gemmata sp. SH-PL17]AMV25718.1 B12 binding domain protein [Gemmata sp. SH-PL17]